jgi:GNAT superfamily N-acetyltransferase
MRIEFSVRRARLEDMAACAAILNDWIDETDWMPRIHSHEEVVQYYETEVFQNRKVLLVEMAGDVAAMAAVTNDNYISAFYVARDYRGRGAGAMLIRHAVAECGTVARLWTFQANAGARSFYARHGFVEIARTAGDNEEGLPEVLLERKVGEA